MNEWVCEILRGNELHQILFVYFRERPFGCNGGRSFKYVSMGQSYIYTLPEQFIKDPSVPMKWKLYALINGFWIGGKEVFASNKFFAEKIGCSERHIQDCLKELEKDGVLQREGKNQNRRILPATNPEFVPPRTGSSRSHEPRVHHISVSISDSEIVEEKEINVDEIVGAKEVMNAFLRFNPSQAVLNRKNNHDASRRMILTHGLEKVLQMVALAERTFGMPYVTTPTTPIQLEENWAKFLSQVSKKKTEMEIPKNRGRGFA